MLRAMRPLTTLSKQTPQLLRSHGLGALSISGRTQPPQFQAASIRPYSSKKGDLTNLQKIFNLTMGNIPGFEKIEKLPCSKRIILEPVENFIRNNKFIQPRRLCLFEVSMIVDEYNKETNSFFDSNIAKGLTSKTIGQKREVSPDANLEYFLKTHINDDLQENETVESSRQFVVNTKEFLLAYVGHEVLSNKYISAKELQTHFETTKQPVYTFLNWGDSEDKQGYRQHAVLVFGIDTNQNISYYDVSDELNTKLFNRFRTMSIDDFNDRRQFSIESIYSRSFVFYKKPK